MSTIEALLNKRWIIKDREKELYYQVKDDIGKYKKFFSEKLGFQIIVNQQIIKLEKLPAKAEAWMGIEDFTETLHYVFLCLVLMFLEDMERGEQFVLSQLTEYIQGKYEEENIDWTLYQNRKHLIKVLKFCISNYMIFINDGSEENFASDYEGDVLYENTGISRYFMKNFTQNIQAFKDIDDFAASEWLGINEDRGIIRRQRVYRRLFLSPGLYKEGEEDEDFAYIKNYRNMIEQDIQELFDMELHVHRTSAYLILGEESNIGSFFPMANTLSDIILLCNAIIHEKIEKGEILVPADENARLAILQFQSLIDECKNRYGSGFVKTYRDKTSSEFYKIVKNYMESYGFIIIDERHDEVLLRPILGKIIGRYPKEFLKVGKGND